MNPFCFRINLSKEERRKRRAAYFLSAVLLSGMFTYGFVTVYRNCYNSMNAEPMTVFRFYQTYSGISLVILNHRIDFY